MSEIVPTGKREEDALKIIRRLREHYFDVRVHQTNRAIPEGQFKVCYPFTIQSSEKTYTVWRDLGHHKTGDEKMVQTENGYIPSSLVDINEAIKK